MYGESSDAAPAVGATPAAGAVEVEAGGISALTAPAVEGGCENGGALYGGCEGVGVVLAVAAGAGAGAGGVAIGDGAAGEALTFSSGEEKNLSVFSPWVRV